MYIRELMKDEMQTMLELNEISRNFTEENAWKKLSCWN